MIIEGLLNAIFFLLEFLINAFPSLTFPADVVSAVAEAVAWAQWVNYYVPLDTAWNCFLTVVLTAVVPAALIHMFFSLF